MFDTGANGAILLENMDKLKVSAQEVSPLVISCDHWDHTYGLSSFLSRNGNILAHLPSAALVQAVQAQGAEAQVTTGPVQICGKVHLTEPMSGAGHCTGDRAIAPFRQAYGDDIVSFGAGSTLTAGTFWKGLIDDVRIYDRALKP